MSAKLKHKSVHALLLAFVLASILFLLPDATVDHDSGFMSSELEVKETVEENVTNTSYVNSDGAITDAIDMGYATVQRTRNANGQVTEEFYLDAAGTPVDRYGDYYGISYEYNDGCIVIKSNLYETSRVFFSYVRAWTHGSFYSSSSDLARIRS